MPWHVTKSAKCPASRPWAVVKDSDGSVVGCHPTEASAKKQLAALNINVAEQSSGRRTRPVKVKAEYEFRGIAPGSVLVPVSLAERAEEDDEQESGDGTTMTGHFAVFDTWAEINSIWEGNFLERISPGAFRKTFKENRAGMRVLFQHGRDPQIGDKPLGPISTLEEDEVGGRFDVPLLDAPYVREDILPGLREGLYGASFRFKTMKEEWVDEPKASDYNPKALPERTLKELKVMEFGPVTFPAYPEASAGVRSLTDYMTFAAVRDDEPPEQDEPKHSDATEPARATRSGRSRVTRRDYLSLREQDPKPRWHL